MKKDRILNKIIITFFYFINFYYVYRYIFKYNGSNTSPTYYDTPVALQIFKYCVAFLFFLIGIFFLFKFKVKIEVGIFEIVISAMALEFMIKSIYVMEFSVFIKYFTFLVMAYFVMFLCDLDDFISKVLAANKIVLIYHIIYSGIQVIFYVCFDRLPALAYRDGYVRFGGGWDDPNSFGIYLCLPIVFLLCSYMEEAKTLKKFMFIFLCIILEIMTLSLTGYCGLFISLFFVVLRYRKKFNWCIIGGISAVGFVLLILNSSILYKAIKWKMGSIELHLKMLLPEFADGSFSSVLFGSNKYIHSENFYNVILKNAGLIYWIGTIGLTIYGIYMSYNVYKKNKSDIICFTCMVFLVTFSIAQMGIPYSLCVPVNYIYWLVYFYVMNSYRIIKMEKRRGYVE